MKRAAKSRKKLPSPVDFGMHAVEVVDLVWTEGLLGFIASHAPQITVRCIPAVEPGWHPTQGIEPITRVYPVQQDTKHMVNIEFTVEPKKRRECQSSQVGKAITLIKHLPNGFSGG